MRRPQAVALFPRRHFSFGLAVFSGGATSPLSQRANAWASDHGIHVFQYASALVGTIDALVSSPSTDRQLLEKATAKYAFHVKVSHTMDAPTASAPGCGSRHGIAVFAHPLKALDSILGTLWLVLTRESFSDGVLHRSVRPIPICGEDLPVSIIHLSIGSDVGLTRDNTILGSRTQRDLAIIVDSQLLKSPQLDFRLIYWRRLLIEVL